MELITEIVCAAFKDPINIFFVALIGVLIFLGIFLSRKWKNLSTFMPSLCASLGVFGTFLGIVLGLYQFDTEHIAESVPKLLDGMKLAFFTSLVGMLASYVLRVAYAIMDDKRGTTSDELVLLQHIEKASMEFSTKISQLDMTLRTMFRSDDEYSLVSQVKLIRQEISDNHRETRKTFEKMLEAFGEMASKSLVEQLGRVVDKFNAMLNDLVSQSFQDLRDSTMRLNAWQAEYKDTIEKNQENLRSILVQLSALNGVYNAAIDKIDILEQHLDSIDASLAGIGLSGDQLSRLSHRLDQQTQELATFLASVKEVGEQAATVIPTINEKTNAILEDMKKLQMTCTNFVMDTGNQLRESEERLSTSMENHAKRLQATTESALADLEGSNKTLLDSLKRSLTEVTRSSENNIRQVEELLEKELSKSLESLGGSMIQLSQKFCSDYLPLTERLREVVRMAEQTSRSFPQHERTQARNR